MTNSMPGPRDGREAIRVSKVRSWIERWEVSLDDIDLEVPEPLAEIDPEEHAFEIEGAPAGPTK